MVLNIMLKNHKKKHIVVVDIMNDRKPQSTPWINTPPPAVRRISLSGFIPVSLLSPHYIRNPEKSTFIILRGRKNIQKRNIAGSSFFLQCGFLQFPLVFFSFLYSFFNNLSQGPGQKIFNNRKGLIIQAGELGVLQGSRDVGFLFSRALGKNKTGAPGRARFISLRGYYLEKPQCKAPEYGRLKNFVFQSPFSDHDFFSKFRPEKIERGGWGSGVAGVAGEVREGAYWPEGPGGREVEVYYPEGLTTARWRLPTSRTI